MESRLRNYVIVPTLLAKKSAHLFLDHFDTARSAGAIDGTPGEPGPGTRDWTDTGSRASINSLGYVVSAGSNAWNDPCTWMGPWPRESVGAVTACIRPRVSSAVGPIVAIAASSAPANPSTGSYGIYQSTSDLIYAAVFAAKLNNPATRRRCIDYLHCVIPRPGGGVMLVISGGIYGDFPTGTVLWVNLADSISDLYAGLSTYSGGCNIGEWGVWTKPAFAALFGSRYAQATVADSFGRANGALAGSTTEVGGLTWVDVTGTSSIVSNKATNSTAGGTTVVVPAAAPKIISAMLTTRAAGTPGVALVFRYIDADNYSFMYLSNRVGLYERVAGAHAEVTNYPQTVNNSTDYELQIMDYGTHVSCSVNGVSRINQYATVVNAAGKGVGFRISDAESLVSDFGCWPAQVTLPAIVSPTVEPPAGVGAAIASDDFTGADGTALSTYDASWITAGTGSWEINSNKARITADDTDGIAVQEVGTADHESTVTIVLPDTPVAQDWFCGVVARYTDINNYIMARYLYQDNSPEVEINVRIGGSGSIIQAVNLGANNLVGGSTYTLKIAVKGAEVSAYHDGELVCQIATTLLTGTKCGIGVQSPTEGRATFDDWEAKAT